MLDLPAQRIINRLTLEQALPIMRFLLFTVSDVFEIHELGCVLLPGVPQPSDSIPAVKRGAPIILRKLGGSEVRTVIGDFELIRRSAPNLFVPISLPRNFHKGDVPSGTEVWYDPELEAGPRGTGHLS